MATHSVVLLRRLRLAIASIALFSIAFTLPVNAQEADKGDDSKAAAKASADESDGEKEKAEEKEVEKDPFALPDEATAQELFAFIRSVQRQRGRTLESVKKAATAASTAADRIRKMDAVALEDELKAIKEQMSALSFLQRFDREAKKQLQTLLEELENDERGEISRVGAVESFKVRIAGARSASKEQLAKMVDELYELIGDRDFDQDALILSSTLARAIGYTDSVDLAASLYEDMAAKMSVSSNATIKDRAPKMLGAARRLRLPGNFMEVMGTTTTGEEFNWKAYRGKVVLVDFWASWCGPCRGEIPNMKQNLVDYGERGFAIVGVNLDRTLEACEKYVSDEELTWENLMSDKEGERGWDNPLASHYGISAIPTAILVDQDGKVVSLKARGAELNRLLEEMLGKPESNDDDDADDDSDDDDDDSDDEE